MEPEDLTDPELKAAIAASLRDLQESHGNHASSSRSGGDIVDLTADSDDDALNPVVPKSKSTIGSETDEEEEDEELKKAIALSMQEGAGSPPLSSKPKPPEELEKEDNENPYASLSATSEASKLGAATNPFGILGLDRKQMERERLARITKRKAEDSISPPPLERKGKMAKSNMQASALNDGTAMSNISTSQHNPQPSQTSISNSKGTARMAEVSLPSSTPSIQFPKGVAKKTWAFGCARTGDDIKIEEVLQKSDMELAVLSSFQWDMEWLFSKLDTTKTRFILVMQAKEETTKRQYESETAAMRNLRLCFPPMEGQVNCMHSKLMLLFHPGYLRIAVPNANLVPYDWGEGGFMENSVFLIDLPKKSDHTAGEDSKTAFYEDLIYFLKATTLHENIIAKLEAFDFSQTARFAFVHTIGGSHSGEAWRRTGHCGLGRAISRLGMRTSKPINIDFVTSSVGSLTDEFLRSIYLASQGDDGLTEFTLRTSKAFPAKSRNDPNVLIQKTTGQEWKDRFKVYFPSETTVKRSKGGPQCAGTICFQSKWFEGPKFPRKVLRDCISRRERLLIHNKMLFARPEEPMKLSDGSRCRAWTYMGSGNLSESAWGRLVQDRTTKEPKLNCRNWECGVVIPIIEPHANDKGSSDINDSSKSDSGAENYAKNTDDHETDIASIFEHTIPVPMKTPGRPYGPGVRPWFYMEN